jgi:hypothetical protein
MKKLTFILISVILALPAFSQSGSGTMADPFYGTISTNVTWNLSSFPGGIIYIGKAGTPASTYNDLTIGTGGHLTIGGGITIIFRLTSSDLIITSDGILTATGSAGEHVKFTKDPGISHWGHISFETPGSSAPITGTGSFMNCIIEYGYASTSGTSPTNAGGGIQVNANNVTVDSCLIENNYSNFGGGITINAGRNASIKNSYFKNNTAYQAGGGLLLWTNSSVQVENCIFEGNYARGTSAASYSGGAIWLLSSPSTVVNCTFAKNISDRAGDAVYSYSSAAAKIVNSLFWGSNDQFAGSIISSTITNCAFETAKPSLAVNSIVINSTNNASDGPNFNATDGTDWSINVVSPCRDAGINSLAGVSIPPYDYIGNPTIYLKDIGAFEVQCSRWKTTASSTDWATDSNWDGGVPVSTRDVVIPAGATNYPTGSSSQDYTIGSGKKLLMYPGSRLTLNSLVNNGTLKLYSAAAGFASLIINNYTRGSGGTEEIQLFLTGGGTVDLDDFKWHYISSPVSSLSTDLFTAVTLDLAQFIESRPVISLMQGWVAFDGYVYSTGLTNGPTFSNLTPGKGYNFWDNIDNTFKISGTLNTDDVSMSLEYSGFPTINGFNLLGNPFSSGLDWNAIIDGLYFTYPENTSKSLYFTRNNIQCSYIGGVGIPSDVNGIIPPMQGFFTKTSSSGNTIILPAAARTHDNIHARYKGPGTLIPLVRLAITENEMEDETVVRYDDMAKPDLDNDFDALKMFVPETRPSIYSLSGDVKYAINGRPYPETSEEIPVVLKLTTDGEHLIKATQLQGLDNYSVSLKDLEQNFTLDLKETGEYSFSAPKGTFSNRFILIVSNTPTGIKENISIDQPFNIYPSGNTVNIQVMNDIWNGKTASVRIYDLSGKNVTSLKDVQFWKNTINRVATGASRGVYIVEIRSGIMRHVGKVVIK